MLWSSLLHASASVSLLDMAILGVVVLHRKIVVHEVVALWRVENGRVFGIGRVEYDVVLADHGWAVRPMLAVGRHAQLLSTFIIGLGLLVLVEHLLDLLDVLFIELLLVSLAFQRATKLLQARVLLLKHHVFLFNRVLGVHELVLQFVTVILAVHSACVEVLILHQLVLQIDRAHLVVWADMI